VDVTGMVSVSAGKAKRKGRRIRHVVTVTNISALRIQGPVSLVLNRMTRKVTLRRASGKTTAWPPLKCFYATLTPADGVFDPGDRLTFALEFTVPAGVAKVRYAARVLAGMGPR
jgi:hypothetical protein